MVAAAAWPCPADERLEDRTDAPSSPLWRFAWISDMHISASTLQYTADSLYCVDTQWKPDFVLFTGDNNGHPAPVDPNVLESRDLRRQRFLKQFLAEHLKTPYVIIPGDNWPEEFDKVFGAKQYSFDRGGLHFVLLAPDRVWSLPKHEGLSVFDTATWDWIESDLQQARQRPGPLSLCPLPSRCPQGRRREPRRMSKLSSRSIDQKSQPCYFLLY